MVQPSAKYRDRSNLRPLFQAHTSAEAGGVALDPALIPYHNVPPNVITSLLVAANTNTAAKAGHLRHLFARLNFDLAPKLHAIMRRLSNGNGRHDEKSRPDPPGIPLAADRRQRKARVLEVLWMKSRTGVIQITLSYLQHTLEFGV